jgi:hypothetical protein
MYLPGVKSFQYPKLIKLPENNGLELRSSSPYILARCNAPLLADTICLPTGRRTPHVEVIILYIASTEGHQKVKESQVVFNDFLPLLNSVPPAAAVTLP